MCGVSHGQVHHLSNPDGGVFVGMVGVGWSGGQAVAPFASRAAVSMIKRREGRIERRRRKWKIQLHTCTMKGASCPLIIQGVTQLMVPRTVAAGAAAAPSVAGVAVSLIVVGRGAKRGL